MHDQGAAGEATTATAAAPAVASAVIWRLLFGMPSGLLTPSRAGSPLLSPATCCRLQCMALQDPAFKFDTRQQAVRDSPWEDFSVGVTFQ